MHCIFSMPLVTEMLDSIHARHTEPGVNTKYLQNAWYAAFWSIDLPAGVVKARTVLSRPLAFFRDNDGRPRAIADRCSHRLAPLSMGHLLPNGHLQCCYHGLEFDADGSCIVNPHTPGTRPNPRLNIPAYPVIEMHGMVWVWPGPRSPDYSAVPDFACLGDTPELHMSKRDYMRIQADTLLVVDNLMDLSHVSFLHEGILGNSKRPDADIKVEQRDGSIYVVRSQAASSMPGIFDGFWPDAPEKVDRWTTIRWSAPSNLLNESGACPPGRGRDEGTGFFGAHILTPETEQSTHYFFAAARWNVRDTDEAVSRNIQERLTELRRFAFEKQDAPVIEAQQLRMNHPDAPEPVLLNVDAGPAQYRRALNLLLREEHAQTSSKPHVSEVS